MEDIDFEEISISAQRIVEDREELEILLRPLKRFFKNTDRVQDNVYDLFEDELAANGMTLYEGDSFRTNNTVDIFHFYEQVVSALKDPYICWEQCNKCIFSQIPMNDHLQSLVKKFRTDGDEYDFMSDAEKELSRLANEMFPLLE